MFWPILRYVFKNSARYKRVGKSVTWICERAQSGLTDTFYGFIKSRKRSIFVIAFYLTTVLLQQLKGMQHSKLAIRKGYHLSIEGIRKGHLFREKWYIEG